MKPNKTIEAEFFYGATPVIFERSRELRKNMTEAEKILWKHIRKGKINGLHFRRQHPVGRFIADFFCHSQKLVIEVDGEIHNTEEQKERDEGRDYMMKDIGLTVLRFTNDEVKNDIAFVIQQIKKHINL